MSRRFKPYRRLRSEIFPLMVVLSVPLVLWAVFPHAALVPVPTEAASSSEASCAFVTLKPEAERHARMAARTSWQNERHAVDAQRIDLIADSLPPFPPRPVLGDVTDLRGKTPSPRTHSAPDLLSVSRAAKAPEKIVPQGEPEEVPLPFPREDLLTVTW